jgi:cell division protein FtsL
MNKIFLKLKNLTTYEKILIGFLLIAIILVASSWNRISTKVKYVTEKYTTIDAEPKK